MSKFTLKSMTAFAEVVSDSPLGQFVVEIRSVNRRFLEVQLDLPKPLAFLQEKIRERILKKIERGHVTLSITWKTGLSCGVKPNIALAREIKKGWDLVAEELDVKKGFSLDLLMGEKGLFSIEESIDREKGAHILEELIDRALEKHLSMREVEGENLKKDLVERIVLMKSAMDLIEKEKEGALLAYREKLRQKIAEFLGENEERLIKEIALYAEKADITEEMVRWRSLVSEFEQFILSPKIGSKGKKLEFFIQELHREITTLGNKALSFSISKNVIEIKSELEKIREQVQNIE